MKSRHRLASLLWLAAAAIALSACKPSPQEGATQYCAKVEASAGGQLAPAQKDQCTRQYLGLGELAKGCVDQCVASAPVGDAFNDCKDDCFGSYPPVLATCIGLTRSDDACVEHYKRLEKNQPKGYACVARCIRRKAPACSAKCGVPDAPAPPPDPGVPPLVP
ncbi:MAG: hypothetical protein KF819_16520 [Labilithrix sp.]|nr:hypothetical protein [Labilithrix sp.]